METRRGWWRPTWSLPARGGSCLWSSVSSLGGGKLLGAHRHAFFPLSIPAGAGPQAGSARRDRGHSQGGRGEPQAGQAIQGEPGLRPLGRGLRMEVQETWASPALLAGGFAPSTCRGALGDLASYGSRGRPSAALWRFCPRNKRVSDHRHICVTLTDRVREVGRAEGRRVNAAGFLGGLRRKGFQGNPGKYCRSVCVQVCYG